jgi:hypothetical protein
MKRKARKYEVVAAAANAGRERRAIGDTGVPGDIDVQRGAPSTIEVSDADYRTVHLPCDALEEDAQQIKKGGRKPGD